MFFFLLEKLLSELRRELHVKIECVSYESFCVRFKKKNPFRCTTKGIANPAINYRSLDGFIKTSKDNTTFLMHQACFKWLHNWVAENNNPDSESVSQERIQKNMPWERNMEKEYTEAWYESRFTFLGAPMRNQSQIWILILSYSNNLSWLVVR